MLGLVAVLAATGCGDSGLGPDPEDVIFDPSLGIDLAAMTKLPSGVYIQTTTEGTGTATVNENSRILAGYKLWLADGRLLQAGDLDILVSGVVGGFAAGVIGMKVDEVRRIVVPARLGYGDQEYGDIPANSVLVFEVTMNAIP
jgi:peptidylprolyl isomerase